MTEGVLRQIAALPSMSSDELREMWRELFGTEPPPHNKLFLSRRLAYRLQELSFGGLSPADAKHLDEMADEIEKTGSIKARRAAAAPVVGARLVRDWQGKTYEVAVLSVGYEYQGRLFKSLSAIARTITGTLRGRWPQPKGSVLLTSKIFAVREDF